MRQIVLATLNPNKAQEIAQLIHVPSLEIVTQSELGIAEIAETAVTFVENALIKARHAAAKSGSPAMADDSGLEVDALNGAPGVISARYAGTGNANDNNAKLLLELQDIPAQQRTARYICIAVFLRAADDPTPIICQGTWEGQILFKPQGSHGFGYDPIFYLPSHQCSVAELTLHEKNKLSHRSQAFIELSKHLHQYFSNLKP